MFHHEQNELHSCRSLLPPASACPKTPRKPSPSLSSLMKRFTSARQIFPLRPARAVRPSSAKSPMPLGAEASTFGNGPCFALATRRRPRHTGRALLQGLPARRSQSRTLPQPAQGRAHRSDSRGNESRKAESPVERSPKILAEDLPTCRNGSTMSSRSTDGVSAPSILPPAATSSLLATLHPNLPDHPASGERVPLVVQHQAPIAAPTF